MSQDNLHFETLQVHAGQAPDKSTHALAVPIYQTTSYQFDNSEHGANLFALKEAGNIYTRLTNPTTDMFERRVAALEGGVGAVATSSGHAAQLTALTAIVRKGNNIVSSPYLYGGTFNQFKHTFADWGIEGRFAESDKAEDIERLIDDDTRAVYVETIGNPGFSVPDFEAVADVAHRHGVPLVVDNTFGCCGYLCAPLKLGADIVTASATKWIGGHGTSMGGVIVDSGRFDWTTGGKYPGLSEPSESYHGICYTETFGSAALIAKCRAEGVRDLGACISPFNSYEMMIGLETLSLRVEREAQNALALARYFDAHPKVERVFYPGLESDPNHENAVKYLRNGFGAVLAVVLKGSKEETVRFVDNLSLVSHVANVGDCKTLIIQPSATTHSQLSPDEQRAAGVLPTLLRISAGIEHIDDLIADFESSFSLI
ncbi:MAG: aminotransferase class I/II-fold pyridoxal phosphate-dependent enzyme [Rikenellaceae bacterium]|nr:aminotransferase class I/II-fold pyridoxal phosphate-dependent enzyme [Rikenellaceae bacterium]